MRRNPKRILLVMILFTSMILQGCSIYKENIKPAGKAKLKRYAFKENGKFEVINFEKQTENGVKSTILTVKDEDTGIVYDVVSKPNGVGGTVDGEYFLYKQKIRSTYRWEYTGYVIKQIDEELTNTYGIRALDERENQVDISTLEGKTISLTERYFVTDDISTYIQDMENIKELIYRYDVENLGFEGRYKVYLVEGAYPNTEVTYYTIYTWNEE